MTCLNSTCDYLSNDIPSSFSTINNFNDNNSFSNQFDFDVKSHGTITFHRNYCNKAHFIRISPDVCPKKVKEYIFKQNPIKRPSIVFSIQGSAKESCMRSKLFQIFRSSLLEIAKTTDIWIITAGLNSRVTRLFGEIVRTNPDPSRPINLIGIASWGCISDVEQLNVHGENVIYLNNSFNEKEETPLEPNHTHFIFIDDQTKFQHQNALKYRSSFEKNILGENFSLKNLIENQINELDNIPVVILVIEGCSDAIKKVHHSVINNGIPIVFIEGTGGCCDLFSKCYHLYNGYELKTKGLYQDKTNKETILSLKEKKEKIREKLRIVNQELAETSCTNAPDQGIDYFQLIYQCVEEKNLFLNFINFNYENLSGDKIILTILESFIKITSEEQLCETNLERKHEQLYLAYQWKQIDLIKNSIMKNERDWKRIELNDLFSKALIENQSNFIELYLDHDFSLNDFFQNNYSKILNLYLNQKKNSNENETKSIFIEILQSLINNSIERNLYFDINNQLKNDSVSVDNEMDYNKELFLWSILSNRHELGLLFWSKGRNKICSALIAMIIYKTKEKKEKNLLYKQWSNQFEYLAVEILEKFSFKYPFKCKQEIVRTIPQYNNLNCLQLAILAQSKLFISKRIVQDLLNDIWFGQINREVGHLSIILSTFCIFYSPFLCYHQGLIEQNYNQSTSSSKLRLTRISTLSDETSIKLLNNHLNKEKTCANDINEISYEEKRIGNGLKGYFENLFLFLNAPYVKYLYNLYSHLIFLLLFSYVILCDYYRFSPYQSDQCFLNKEEEFILNKTKTKDSSLKSSSFGPSITEIILIFWIFTLLSEEIRQLKSQKMKSIYIKVQMHFRIFWNQLDGIGIFLFILSCFLRFFPRKECFCLSRIVLSLDLSIWFIRTLDMFSAIKRLGPKLVMIGEMVYDLIFYMLMLIVFMLAFGVPTYSLLNGVKKYSWHIPRNIINLAYWQIFGELQNYEQIENNYSLSGYVMFILLIFYMIIANILLINLLIAMFSNTFDRFQSDTDSIWKFQQYSLVCYYLKRPLFPSPFIIFSHFYYFIKQIFFKIFKRKSFQQQNPTKTFKIEINEMLRKEIEEIEDAFGNEVYFISRKNSPKELSSQINHFNEEQIYSSEERFLNKIQILENQIQIIQNQQSHMFEYFECLINGIKKFVNDDIQMPKMNRDQI